MKMKSNVLRFLLLICCIQLLVACNGEQKEKFATYHTEGDNGSQSTIEKLLKEEKSIKKGTAVFVDDVVLVGVQIKPFSKLKRSKIEKDLQKKFEKEFPGKEVLVSTDFKISWEAQKLMKKELTKEELKKKIKKLQDLAKEET
ncbi:YhcN/YlaJ family sporulation lipoprotein [Viridibacillus sp. NPDC096237]|uniref:YhcN/YlaJ family sporulation lipoprotein n=1 Tax=Viridibacillus sp. NPDC096237 TaxID=3390721 RepID=UPI003CFD37DF